MLAESYIEKILDYAVSCGADYGEVFFEDTERTKLTLMDSQVLRCACGRESGIGIRVFRGLESEYLYSADANEKRVLGLMKERLGKGGVFGKRTPLSRIEPNYITMRETVPREMGLKRKLDYLKAAAAAGKKEGNPVLGGAGNYLGRRKGGKCREKKK